jgi:hypothetical protein
MTIRWSVKIWHSSFLPKIAAFIELLNVEPISLLQKSTVTLLHSRIALRPLEIIDEAPNGVANHFAFVDVYSLQDIGHICLKKLLTSV